MSEKLSSFAPILPERPAVLILGSMPSSKSQEKQEYYGNPRNHFWDILYKLFDQDPLLNYDQKIAFVKKQRIALWDMIGSCYRTGSLDSNITDEEPNDIVGLITMFSSIRLIACNGTKSFQTFWKYVDKEKVKHIEVMKLPSTSPIPGRYTKSFNEKVKEWSRILSYV